jgi:UDP-N-acetylmuramate dehydrogenase
VPFDLEIREAVALAPFTTFGIGGAARYFVETATPAEVQDAVIWARERGLALFVLGGGSNLLVKDAGFDGLVLKVVIRGMNHLGAGVFAVGAGEGWDDFVQFAVERRFAGIECLAGIPGSVGGTPVQNVGAYGQEVAETIVAVHAFDRQELRFVTFDASACHFRYRSSLFNSDEPNRYVVCRVDFQLRADGIPRLEYADLKRRFGGSSVSPTLLEVATAVRDIRRSKGMLLVEGDADCRSAGSFFKNPIVGAERLAGMAAAVGLEESKVPHWPAGEGKIKIPAAWLLEQAGFVKGYGEGAARISTRHTLALTNRGGAEFADVERLQDEIVSGVLARFGIKLEREPVVVG